MKRKILIILLFTILLLPITGVNALTVVDCGNVTSIPKKIPELTSLAVTIIEIAIPVILVIMGSIDLFKGITSQKEDEMKKATQLFIKRLITAAIVFFVIAIVKFIVSLVADSSTNNINSCIDCFLSGSCQNERTKYK